MNLRKYNDKIIRIITINDEIYDGLCSYNEKEYNLLELGINEESLQILSYLFFSRDIKEIIVLDKFLDDFGLLEEEIVSEGVDEITDAIEYTIDDHTYRILCCLEKHPEFEDKKEILDYVKSYDFKDNRIQDKLIELENNWLKK